MATKKISELPLILTLSGSQVDGGSVLPVVVGGTTNQISVENFSRFATAYSATTSSNNFLGTQNITGNVSITGVETVTGTLNVVGGGSVSGDFSIGGKLTVQELHTELTSASILFESGSTILGNTADDTHTVTGTILLNGQALGTGQLNAYTGSLLSQTTLLSTFTTSINLATASLNLQTGSQDLVNRRISSTTGSINTTTSSFDSVFLRISSTTGSINTTTSSFNSVFLGISSVTGAMNTQSSSQNLVNLAISTYTGSQNIINSSVDSHILKQASQTGSQDLVNLGISSVTGSLIGITNGLMAFTAALDNTYATDAQLYQLYQATASIQAFTSSQDSRNFTISQITSSIDAHILKQAIQTGSQDLVNLGISTFTGSIRSEIGGIEAYTASLKGATIVSSSTQIFTGYDYEIHVSQVDGNDTTGNGDLLTPVATITKALQIVTANFGVTDRRTIILHPGTYTENPTISIANTYIFALGLLGANTVIAGTLTINAACRVSGIKMTNLVVNTTSPVYINNTTVDTQMTVTNTGYLETTGCSFQCPSGVTVSGAAPGVVFNSTTLWGLVVSNASAIVIVRNSPQVLVATVTAGNLALSNTLLFSSTPTGNAITTSAGTVVTLSNLNILDNTGLAVARVSLSGFYSIIDVVYDKPNSTLVALSGTGGPLNAIDYFQYINADKFVTQGGTGYQFLKGDGSLDSTMPASLQQTTASLNLQTGSQNTVNFNISIVTSSIDAHILKQAIQTGSQDLVNLGISTYTGSQNVINTSIDAHILKQAIQTGSQDLVNLGISTFTGSLRSEVNLIEAYTSSLKNAFTIDGNNDVYFTGKITTQEVHTTYTTSSVLFQSGSTKFGNSSDDIHEFTGSKFEVLNSDTSGTMYAVVKNNRARNAAVQTTTTNGSFIAGTSIGTDAFQYQIYDAVEGVNRVTINSQGGTTLQGAVSASQTLRVTGKTQIGTSTVDTSLGSNTKLSVVGDGSVNAGASQGSMFVGVGVTGGDTGLPLNMGTAGATMMLLASINTSTGTSTNSATYVLQFYFDGNTVPNAMFLTGSSNFVTFAATPSNTLAISGSSSGNKSYAWFINKFGA
jgi:hypothetical protein